MLDLKYKNQIQFLRGLSVIFVFLYHSNIFLFNKGYLGVDIFFVISGFVITQRIFQDYEIEKKINLTSFYVKRFKRIIPNLFFIVSVTYFVYLVFGPPDLSLWSETISSLFGVSNFYYIIQNIDYFNNIFDDPLGHTWSLGVEEQFYLFYPFLIFFIFRFKKNRIFILKISLSLIFILSLFTFENQLEVNPLVAFYFSPFRFWELIFGGILFFYNHKVVKSNLISFTALFLIIYLIFSQNNYDYFLLNVSIVFLAGIFITTFEKSLFIENKYFIYLGSISYSFYLWHLPVIFFFDLYFPNIYYFDILLSFIATILLSTLTFYYIEQKFRHIELKKTKIIKYIIIVLFFIFVFLIYAKYFNNELRGKLKNVTTNINYLDKKYDWNKKVVFHDLIYLADNNVYEHCQDSSLVFTKNSDNLKNECLKQKNYKSLFYVEGDSHTAQYIPMFNALNSLDNIYFKHSEDYKISFKEINKLTTIYKEVIYVTNITNLRKLNKIIDDYSNLNTNIKIILFNSTPYPLNKSQPIKCLIQQINCTIEKNLDMKKRDLDRLFFEMVNFKKKYDDNVFIFNSYESLCPKIKCKIYDKINDILFYRDETHLAFQGSEYLIIYFQEFIEQLKKNKNIYQY